MVLLASSLVTITSWSFSPGLTPMTFFSHLGHIASARSPIPHALGILGTNNSPPTIFSTHWRTKSTPFSRVIQNLVICGSVTESTPVSLCFIKKGIHTSSTAKHVSIPYDAENRAVALCVGIACDKELIRAKFARPVKVDRIRSLIRTHCNDLSDPLVDGHIDDVLSSYDIGFYGLEGVAIPEWAPCLRAAA